MGMKIQANLESNCVIFKAQLTGLLRQFVSHYVTDNYYAVSGVCVCDRAWGKVFINTLRLLVEWTVM